MKKKIKLILILIWMFIIFLFSNQNGSESSKVSDGLIIKVANILVDEDLNQVEKENLIDKYVVFTRKSAHFFVYLVLGLLVINFLREYNFKNIVMCSLSICLLYAATDEFHQLFVKGRSGQVRDVLIDTLGSLVGICSYLFVKKLIKNKNR